VADPIAYFITWSCYATWLHGDTRGSVDPAHNSFGTPRLSENTRINNSDASLATYPPVTLSTQERELVDRCIRDHCQFRGWTLHALNVRTNHVHVVVSANVPPEKVMGEFKSWCSRRLREGGMLPADQPVWTRHGSTRYIWRLGEMDDVVKYTLEAQDDPSRWPSE